MRISAIAVVSSCLTMSSLAWAAAVDVTAPDSIVRSAPFDVAPALARVHGGDKLEGEESAQSGWLRVALPDGRHGFLHATDARVAPAPTPPPAAPPPPADQVTAPAPGPAPPALPAQETAAIPAAPAVATPAAPAPTAAASGTGPMLVGLAFELFPAGTLASKLQANSVDTDAQITGGLAPFLDAPVTRWLALGVSPQFVFNVRAPGATQSWTEYDLRARITLQDPNFSSTRLFARLSPGFSMLSPPAGVLPPNVEDPAGFLVDFSIGSQTQLGPDALLLVDIGYQLGFQGTSVNGQDVDSRTRFLHVGFGFALGL